MESGSTFHIQIELGNTGKVNSEGCTASWWIVWLPILSSR